MRVAALVASLALSSLESIAHTLGARSTSVARGSSVREAAAVTAVALSSLEGVADASLAVGREVGEGSTVLGNIYTRKSDKISQIGEK